MKALLNWMSALPAGAVWGKIKLGLLATAVAFMLWQGWQMKSLQHDVAGLETVQSSLQAQVQQMAGEYTILRENYKNSAKTSEQYFNSAHDLNGKSLQLEKDFAALEITALKASEKADTALSLQQNTIPRVSNETTPTQAHTSTVGGVGSRSSGDDAEWRKLLDQTFCTVHPTDPECPK